MPYFKKIYTININSNDKCSYKSSPTCGPNNNTEFRNK